MAFPEAKNLLALIGLGGLSRKATMSTSHGYVKILDNSAQQQSTCERALTSSHAGLSDQVLTFRKGG